MLSRDRNARSVKVLKNIKPVMFYGITDTKMNCFFLKCVHGKTDEGFCFMRTKHMLVLIHIRNMDEVGTIKHL